MKKRNQIIQKTMKIFISIIVLGIVVYTSPVKAQSSEADTQESLRRVSIGLQGGLATGNMDINTKYTGTYGGNIRFSFNPMISLQANILLGEFLSDDVVCDLFDPSFSNPYTSINLQGHLNMYPFLSRKNAPAGFKIYSLLGAGFIQSDVKTAVENPVAGWEDFSGEDNTDMAFYYQFGLGARVKLSGRVDLFTQFDYNIAANDRIDGFKNSHLSGTDLDNGRNDHFLNFTAGLQFRFGSSSRKHADWHWKSTPPPIIPEPEPEEDDRIEELEEELDEKQGQIDELYNSLRELEDVTSVEQVDDRVIVTFNNDVLFNFDSSELKPQVIQSIDQLLQKIANSDADAEDLRLTIVGHTCNIGTEEYNQGLSERRAASVTSYLTENGFDRNRIISLGRGETEPKFDNTTSEGRSRNRRVEIMIE